MSYHDVCICYTYSSLKSGKKLDKRASPNIYCYIGSILDFAAIGITFNKVAL